MLRGQNFSKTSLSHTAPLLWAAGQTNIAVKLHQYGEEHAHLLFCVWRKKKKKALEPPLLSSKPMGRSRKGMTDLPWLIPSPMGHNALKHTTTITSQVFPLLGGIGKLAFRLDCKHSIWVRDCPKQSIIVTLFISYCADHNEICMMT